MPNPPSLHPVLVIRPWDDPLVEARGFAPESAYVEQCWLPVLGPTATWLYRRLAALVSAEPEVRLDLVELGLALGLGTAVGRNSVLARSLGRLVRFGVARCQGDSLEVRRVLAPVATAQLVRLPAGVQAAHHRLLAEGGGGW